MCFILLLQINSLVYNPLLIFVPYFELPGPPLSPNSITPTLQQSPRQSCLQQSLQLCRRHKSWKSVMQIMSSTFMICVRDKVCELRQGLCRKHLDMLRWFVFTTFTVHCLAQTCESPTICTDTWMWLLCMFFVSGIVKLQEFVMKKPDFSPSKQGSNWQHQLRLASLYSWLIMTSALRHD